MSTVIEARGLVRRYPGDGAPIRAVDGVDLAVEAGEADVELPALLVGVSRRAARGRAMELLQRLGVAERADRLPDQLSGGEQQRVAVARALINEPVVVLGASADAGVGPGGSPGRAQPAPPPRTGPAAPGHPPDEPGDRALVAELRRRATQLTGASGVVAAGGPWTNLYGSVQLAGGTEDLTAEVRDPGPYQVDQPLVTSGRWLGEGGGVMLESGLAATLDSGAGDTVIVQGRPFPVRGVAQTVSRGRFPLSRPAQVWVTPETARQLRALGMTEEGFELQLRLADPTLAADFVGAHRSLEAVPSSSSIIPHLETWQQRRIESHSDIDILAGTLFAAGTLIAVLTVATASVLIAGRMAARIRQVGTLKAVGVTPRRVMLVLLLEHLAIAAGATAVGLGIGRLLAPPIAATSVTVLGRPQPPPLTVTRGDHGRRRRRGGAAGHRPAGAARHPPEHAAVARHPARGRPGTRAGWRALPPAPASPCRACWGCGRPGGGRAGCSPTRPGWPSGWP